MAHRGRERGIPRLVRGGMSRPDFGRDGWQVGTRPAGATAACTNSADTVSAILIAPQAFDGALCFDG